MAFRPDWLLYDPIEIVTEQLPSILDLENLTMPEDISCSQKALLILDNGQLCQKRWIVQYLSLILQDPGSDRVIAELMVNSNQMHLPYWDEPTQTDLAKSLVRCLENDEFPEKHFYNLINSIFNMLDSETWQLLKSWGQVFQALAPFLPQTCLEEKCLPRVLELCASTQPDIMRAVGGCMLCSIVNRLKHKSSQAILKLCLISQDPSSFVRKQMCIALQKVFYSIGPNQIQEKILELANDETLLVFSEGVSLLSNISESSQSTKTKILDIFRGYFNLKSDKFIHVVIQNIGTLMYNMREFLTIEDIESCVNLVYKYVQEGQCYQHAAAYNFPALLAVCGDLDEKLLEILEKLCNSPAKRCMAKQFADICVLAHNYQNELNSIFLGLAENPDLRQVLFSRVFKISQRLDQHDPHLLILMHYLDIENSWRVNRVILQESKHYVKYASFEFFQAIITQKLFQIIEKQHPVQDAALEFITQLIKYTENYQQKAELRSNIIDFLCKSKSCRIRCMFFKFCLMIKKSFSRQFFKKHVIKSLLNLALDPVIDVRIQFAYAYSEFYYCLNEDDTDSRKKFQEIRLKYQEHPALNAFIHIEESKMTPEIWNRHFGKHGMAIDDAKLKFETSQESKFLREEQQERNRVITELTDQYKKRCLSSTKYVKRFSVGSRGLKTGKKAEPEKNMRTYRARTRTRFQAQVSNFCMN